MPDWKFTGYKAQPIDDKERVESLTMIFNDTIPSNMTVEQLKAIYEAEARQIEYVLFMVLPGGTYDRLMTEMLERKASMLRVPFGGKDDKK